MPSGFDACEQDFVFFRHAQLYALACFHRLQTNSDSEREVRMRSVAVFAQELAALQAPELASALLQHAKRLNATPDATAPLFDLLQPKSRFSWGKQKLGRNRNDKLAKRDDQAQPEQDDVADSANKRILV